MRLFKDKLLLAIVIIAVVLIGVVVGTSDGKTKVTFVEGIVSTVTRPVQKAFTAMGDKIGSTLDGLLKYKDLQKENEKLKEEIDKLREENRDVYELRIRNKTLEEQLNFADSRPELNYIGSNIIAKDPGNWFDTFIIDKGKDDGVAVNDAVVIGTGLVGRVVEADAKQSKVVSIIDERSSISALVSRTRATGIANGTEDKKIVAEMLYDADIIKGDEIVTSDYSNLPKGLYLGKVISVKKDDANLKKIVEIEPAVDFERLELVFVVKEKKAE